MFKTIHSLFDNSYVRKPSNFKFNIMKSSISLLGAIILFLSFVLSSSGLNAQAITSFPHSTNFASGFGDWNQSASDDFNWTQTIYATGSSGTGPQASPYGANGTTGYAYTET